MNSSDGCYKDYDLTHIFCNFDYAKAFNIYCFISYLCQNYSFNGEHDTLVNDTLWKGSPSITK